MPLPRIVIIQTAASLTDQTVASILVIYTGGTVGMAYNHEGLLAPMRFSEVTRLMPELRDVRMRVSVLSMPQPIDSSNVSPADWITLASLIGEFYNYYDGFVVLHGTDTMAYSASALSYMLENLAKPVVFTGAQVPAGRVRTDARRNFITALEIAAARHPDGNARVPEVSLFFNTMLMRGNRTKKVESQHFGAFRSDNMPPLAQAGIRLTYNDVLVRPLPKAPLHIHTQLNDNVTILKLFPGITERVVNCSLTVEGLRGCVLETFGSGNASTQPWFLNALKEAHERGVHILNVSQCDEGRVEQGRYETSASLPAAGVLSGDDITTEAAITKLMFVLGLQKSHAETTKLLVQNLRGEITLL
ncbi:type I asparaginase [Hymenobacter sp. GOD-10R]|uniref:asparaginase n=1 Tax=Hymenobacter sp. GOD-10R TaxID=3093922 RepID=UPI002D76B162|nr:type I asparaginase [Hymenobacter sp. GOD-10R]WRQ26853.1 type I asparaginase [Hymenobacter sp. GOD-10R]